MGRVVDIAVVGAGAAGLMAAIWAGRSARAHGAHQALVVLDGARKLGAKILVAGGGRCNVTHHAVDETAYAGSSRPAIRNILRRFDVPQTVEFFKDLGVTLKREDTGKLFPVTDDAHTVLDALLGAARDAGAALEHPWRVHSITREAEGFVVQRAPTEGADPGADQTVRARRVILASGGQSLPKTGSDGHGYALVRALGHSVTRTFPGLVPLTLPRDHFICALSGLTVPATLELRIATGRRAASFTNSTLCTHFGLSGPSVLDISRYYLALRGDRGAGNQGASLIINWLPGQTMEAMDTALAGLGAQSPGRWLAARLPERLARALCAHADVDPALPGHQLSRERRRALARAVCEMPLPVAGDRGYNYAEVTAGGVPLSEVHLKTMESRVCPGLFLCGEICDVDGRIGGFNFQWAWASGHVAGVGAALPQAIAARSMR